MRPLSLRWLILSTVIVLMSTACGDSGDATSETTIAPSTTVEETTTTPSTTTAPSSTTSTVEAEIALPGPGEPWDLLFFGVDEILTRQLGELYADYAADALAVEVRLYEPPGFDHVYAAQLVGKLKGVIYPPLGEFVPPAEIIVLMGRPGATSDGSDDHIADDFENCWWRPANGTPPTTDLPADY